ncbi:hypothetical protein VNO77_09391 [Canavalia gladiata]|uniref:Uncharacterized protein n=1 Tax=Canavalia gladiata TaxID=3824 RepID=A0AAN9M974_CANGL
MPRRNPRSTQNPNTINTLPSRRIRKPSRPGRIRFRNSSSIGAFTRRYSQIRTKRRGRMLKRNMEPPFDLRRGKVRESREREAERAGRAVRSRRMITSQDGEATCGECDCRLVRWESVVKGKGVILTATVHMKAYDGKLRLSSNVPTPVTASVHMKACDGKLRSR